MKWFPAFGTLPSGERAQRISRSPNYREGAFQNPVPTEVMAKEASMSKMMLRMLNRPAASSPVHRLPSVKTELDTLPDERPLVVWFGHSSYYIRYRGISVLVDPVFSGNASPVSFFGHSYPGSDVYGADDFHHIDVLVITHDHYDHLDYQTILALQPKIGKVCTSLGVGAHLEYWGIDPARITELDWWEQATMLPGMTFTAMPARHFSGRALKRGQTLWSGFVLQWDEYAIFIGGDSGYGEHFKAIGNAFGPFDIVFLEAGQYNKDWPYIHMHPEETVQAAIDLQASVLMPVHWGKFTLAFHDWNEPPELVKKAAAEKNLRITTPLIGEPVILGNVYPTSWWKS